jgi:hypothetical protein
MPTAKEIARAVRLIRATYNIGLLEAIALWRGMTPEARRSWTRPA